MVPLIICFGDSLTAGYQSPTPDHPGLVETPYGAFLQEQLGARARVEVSGICGELTGEMAMRFREHVLARKPDFVVILGGTNDLGMNAQPAEVMQNLLKMYESARSSAVQPIPVTVPSVRFEGLSEVRDSEAQKWIRSHLDRRDVLNRLITEYATRQHLAVIDLFTATVEPDTRFLAAAYSNDGLHLTTRGYRLMATLLYEQVFRVHITD